MNKALRLALGAVGSLTLSACEPSGSGVADALPPADRPQPQILVARTGRIRSDWLDEISGIQASRRYPGLYWVHDDDGHPRLGAIDAQGASFGHVTIPDTGKHDWEDITLIPRDGADLLVICNTGDNDERRDFVSLLLVEEPERGVDGRFAGEVPLVHQIRLTYPDRAQDVEAVAFDPNGLRLLFLAKRSRPPRLYALDLDSALGADAAELEYLGAITSFRPPTDRDVRTFGDRARWVSQPTGLDIAPDGSRAAVITYRSLYLFDAPPSGDWKDGLNAGATEIIGPNALQEEAISFTPDAAGLIVTAEGANAPVYMYKLKADP